MPKTGVSIEYIETVVEFSVTCEKCGSRVHADGCNDDLEYDKGKFRAELEADGWHEGQVNDVIALPRLPEGCLHDRRGGVVTNAIGAVPAFLTVAIRTCLQAHQNQVDKAGRPYYLHPLRVMGSLKATEDAEVLAAAVLHDVVEDTDLNLEDLKQCMPPRTVALVDAMSRRDSEDYFTYIRRIRDCGDPGAVRIKIADLNDNTKPERYIPGVKLYERYFIALAILEGREL